MNCPSCNCPLLAVELVDDKTAAQVRILASDLLPTRKSKECNGIDHCIR